MRGADPSDPFDDDTFTEPLDADDPRFAGAGENPHPRAAPPVRRLEPSRGPGPDLDTPAIRVFRVALPLVFAAGVAAVAAVFFLGLRPGVQHTVVGPADQVRAAVADRPKRVCFNDNNPCAWLTLVEGEIVAFNTNGPLPQEFGRQGVGWCPTSGWFGANATGSRYDQQGRVAGGSAPRGLDRFAVRVRDDGALVVDFRRLTAGTLAGRSGRPSPPAGPDCPVVPFDRAADLRLDGD